MELTPKEQQQKRILEMQKDLMNEALQYSIDYGPGSLSWNINLNFIEVIRK